MFARPREGAGRLEDHASCHFHGVVGKALVESAQQRHVDGGRHSVLPFAVHQHGEQMPVQVVHRVVFFADLGGLFRVVRQHDLLGTVAQFDCNSSHFGKITVDLFGQRVLWMPTAGDLGDMQRQRPHPVDVSHHLDGAHNGSEVTGDRCLQRQKNECTLLGPGA